MTSYSDKPNSPKDERGNTVPRGEGMITKQTERNTSAFGSDGKPELEDPVDYN